jgi:2-phosphosulfolactate phosphatase
MATTNGTRALSAARSAAAIFAGALVNAAAVARAAGQTARDVLLLGSGTDGQISMEDVIGAGAVCHKLLELGHYSLAGDTAWMAIRLFESARNDLPAALRETQGGLNNIKVGQEADIDFAARLDVLDVVGKVDPSRLLIRRLR